MEPRGITRSGKAAHVHNLMARSLSAAQVKIANGRDGL